MRKFIGFIFYLFCLAGAVGQDKISMLLHDQNFVPIPQGDVNSILVSICGPDTVTAIFKEEYKSPMVTNGIVNLRTGSGTKLSPLNYDESIRQYYNSLPPDKRPTSESFLIVKLEVKLNSGKSIAFMNEIKFNTSVPLIKGDKKEFSYLSDKVLDIANETEKTNVSPFGMIIERLSSEFTNRSIFKSGSSELINGINKILLDPSTEVNFISGPPGTQQKFFFNPFSFGLTNNQTPIWTLDQSGFEYQYANLRASLVDAGIVLEDTSGGDRVYVAPGLINIINNNQPTWNINDDGYTYNYLPDIETQLYQGNFTTSNLKTLAKTEFSPGSLAVKNNLNFGWDFAPGTASWKTDKDKSFTFNSTPNFGTITSDLISKRRLETSYAGIAGFHDSKNSFNLAVGSTGVPFLNMFRTNNSLASFLSLNSESAADFRLTGSAGTPYIVHTSVAGSNGQRPYLFITLDGITPLAGIYIDAQGRGVVFGTLKNFNMDHPLHAEKNIVYSSLEGPEAAAYCRGKAQIKDGKAFVPFPEHFILVCAPEDMTVQATPRSVSSKGLAITSISEKGFTVQELMGGVGNYEIFWEVKGVRKGFEDYQVIRPKNQVIPAEFVKPVMDRN